MRPGTVRVLLYAGGMNDDDVTTMLDGAAEKGAATFVLSVLEGPDQGRSVAVTDGLFVGKSEACELPLTDPKVSRRHAQMTHEGAYLRLRDTGSTNGTYLNGGRVVEALLRDGDRVRLGDTNLLISPTEDRTSFRFEQRGNYDREILRSLYDELPRDVSGKASAHRAEAHQRFIAMARRRAFFERRDMGWRSMLPYKTADDLLAVEAGHDAQRAVGGRVLGAHVEGHALVGLELEVHPAIGGLAVGVGELLAIGHRGHQPSSPSVPSASSASPPSDGIGSTSTMPGHGFTWRASSGKVLRSGCPSNSAGR